MLCQSTKYKLYLLLKAILENETIVEEQRQRLSAQPDYEPYAAFKRIERNSTANLTNGMPGSAVFEAKLGARNLCQFLQENMVDYADEAECMLAVKFFDKDEDGYLSFEE